MASTEQRQASGMQEGILKATEASRTLTDGVHLIPTQGNSLAIETAAGVVVIDAGPGGRITEKMIETLRTYTDAPVRAIIYSHGHIGYNTGIPLWLAHAEQRGDEPPARIAHERCVPRYTRYRETLGLQYLLNTLPGDDAVVDEARRAKAEWCDALADPTVPFVSRSLYKGSARLLRNGRTRWSQAPEGVHCLPER